MPGQLGGLELRHRQHARVEDRIRQAKATGLANLPCHRSDANAAWLEIILAATDLVAWTKLIGFTEHRDLATCEIDTFRYRVLHVAARITRGARQIRLADRRHLAMGHRHLPRMATTPSRLHLTAPPPSTRPEEPHRPWKRPPTERHRPTCHTHLPQSAPTSRPAPAPIRPDKAARKIEARGSLAVCRR